MDKDSLRQELLAHRSGLGPGVLAAESLALCKHLAAWSPFSEARIVLAYLAFRNELSLAPLMDSHPEKTWALPRTLGGGRMTIHHYLPGKLVTHRYGMLEPLVDSPPVPLTEIDLALIPGLGFDRQGIRLGYGGGYYDRLLPQLGALRVGIVHPSCMLLEIPHQEHDCRMDWLAGPQGLWRINNGP